MTIRVRCEECGRAYRLRPELAGQILPCKECGADMDVPGRRGGRSGEVRTRGRSPRRRSSRQKNGIPTGVWIAGVLLLVLLIGVGVFFWVRSDKAPEEANAGNATASDPKNATPSDNTWNVDPQTLANLGATPAEVLGPVVAIDQYAIRVPKGWMPVSSEYGRGKASIEWKWPAEDIDSRLELTVKLNDRYHAGDRPNIHTGRNVRTTARGDLYIYTNAKDPEQGRIHGVEFTRLQLPEVSQGKPSQRWEYIAILDGATVQISTEVALAAHTKLCGHAEAAALSFQISSTAKPVISREQVMQSRSERLKGFPQPQFVASNFADFGIRTAHPQLGEPEFVIIAAKEDLDDSVLSTPGTHRILVKDRLYDLQAGKELARIPLPDDYAEAEHKALRDDGEFLAFAEQQFSRKDGKIHLLSNGGQKRSFLQESQTRSRSGILRLEFLEFLPDQRLVAGWNLFSDYEIDVYDVKTGEQKRWEVKSAKSGSFAISPDSRFAAMIDPKSRELVLDSLLSPQPVRTGLQNPAGSFGHSELKSLKFSPDGKQLAGIPWTGRELVVWSINGPVENQIPLTPGWGLLSDRSSSALQWLSDGSGWLLHGRILLDRSGQPRWMLPDPRTHQNLLDKHRLLKKDRILVTRGDETTPWHIGVYRLPAK